MAQFIAFDENVEVNGETVLSLVKGSVMKEKALKLLEKHGIINPTPKKWYNQQAWLNAFREIAETIGPKTLHAIGGKIPTQEAFTFSLNSMEQALTAINTAYHMSHRNGMIGEYRYESADEHSARIICHTPYPCDFERGLIHAVAMRFLPQGSIFADVQHEPESGCRKLSDDTCIYRVTW